MPQIVPLDPATYRRHALHGPDRTWIETNCYSDIIIELLHALGHEPLAALAFALTIDFDLDQWTFFKFPPGDIEALYGLSLNELAPWRPLADHIEEQVRGGRPVLVELDSFFLPDTLGTAYRQAHVKSTVAVNAIDVAARTLGYFHNQGYHHLDGQDFTDVFQVHGLVHERMLPPYIEFVKRLPNTRPLEGAALVEASLGLLQRHLRHVPTTNPFLVFQERFAADVEWLMKADISAFHTYSFVTLRQSGACFGLAASGLEWLAQQGVPGVAVAAAHFDEIARSTKTFQFQVARAMARRRPLDLAPLAAMAGTWERGMAHLRHVV